jgi:hypothetical protein
MKMPHQFRVVRRPEEVASRYAILVVDSNGPPHRPLTIFYHELQQYVANGTAHTYQLVLLAVKSPSTVRVFLSALKQFYHIARRLGWYPYTHPLIDSVAHLMQEVEAEERQAAGLHPRMPQRSGVEDPKQQYTSDNYFKLVGDEWQPQPIDNPNLHVLLRKGFKQARISLWGTGASAVASRKPGPSAKVVMGDV